MIIFSSCLYASKRAERACHLRTNRCPQVGYCQGMAFVAGVILMYLPEEPAFRMLMSLMAETGPNLRRLYTPGLEGLKTELRKFEWLMMRNYAALAAHLEARPYLKPEHSIDPSDRPVAFVNRRAAHTTFRASCSTIGTCLHCWLPILTMVIHLFAGRQNGGQVL